MSVLLHFLPIVHDSALSGTAPTSRVSERDLLRPLWLTMVEGLKKN